MYGSQIIQIIFFINDISILNVFLDVQKVDGTRLAIPDLLVQQSLSKLTADLLYYIIRTAACLWSPVWVRVHFLMYSAHKCTSAPTHTHKTSNASSFCPPVPWAHLHLSTHYTKWMDEVFCVCVWVHVFIYAACLCEYIYLPIWGEYLS